MKEEIIEQLADKEHASWARWMHYLFSKCGSLPDGSLVIPEESVTHWKRQTYTPYEQLSEREKQSDRDEVAHIIPIIELHMNRENSSQSESVKVEVSYTLEEWQKLKKVFESIREETLTDDQLKELIAGVCHQEMMAFADKMTS